MSKFFHLIIALVFLSAPVFSQEAKDTLKKASDSTEEIFTIVEVMPEFPGGTESLYKWIATNLSYPAEAKKQGITGKVFIGFTVDKDGNVIDVDVIRSAHPLLDQAAVDLIQQLPQWSPGIQRGKPVKVRYALPLDFKLADTSKNTRDKKKRKKKKE